MENKHQKSERSSEISYLKLQNTRDVQTPEEGNFILKQEFLTHLLQMNMQQPKLTHKEHEKDSFNYQSDEQFLKQVFQIVEKHMSLINSQQHKKPLDDEICNEIHQKCIKHREANKFNVNTNYHFQPDRSKANESKKVDEKAQFKCFCGCGKYAGDPLPLCTDELQYYFFGPLILVFFYLRKMITVLVVLSLVYGVYSVVTNLISAQSELESYCSSPGMLSFLCPIKYLATTVNKIPNVFYEEIQVWLGVVLCLIWILSVRVIRSLGRCLNKKIDGFLDSSSDYVIQILNLPYGGYTETQLLKYVASLWQNLKGKSAKLPQIKSVQIIYQMDESRKLVKSIIENACKLSANLVKREIGDKICYQIKQGQLQHYLNCKMQLIKSIVKIQDYRSKFINDSQFRKQLATDIAFVEFSDSNDQAELLKITKQYRITILGEIKEYLMGKIFGNQDDSYVFKGNNIRITRAPEPSDINWLNCQKKNSYKRIALVWFISFIMVSISFGFLMFIRFLRNTFSTLEFMSILFSISLQAFNRIIWNTLVSAIGLEQNNTSTDNVISIMSKGAFAQAINVLVLPLIFNYVMRNNLYGPEGLISSTLDYHFTFFFMQIFLNFINVPYQTRRILLMFPKFRKWFINRYSNVVGVVDTGEEIKQVLSYYETPPFSIASVYTSTNTIIFHTMFYIHIQPLLIFTLIFNLFSVYVIQKYLFLRRYKIPELVDFIIFENCFSYLQHVPLIYAAGSLTFIYLTEQTNGSFNTNYIPSILCIALWLVGVLNPLSVFNKITKFIVGRLGYSETQNKQSAESSQKMAENIVSQTNNDDSNVYVRRQSYHKACGTNDLLQYQAKLTQILRDDEYDSVNKAFCERFSIKAPEAGVNNTDYLKTSTKKNSMKLLPRMKQSFAIVKQTPKPPPDNRKSNNNRIIPIDIYSFNQNAQFKNSIKFQQGNKPPSTSRQNKQGMEIIKLKQNKENSKQNRQKDLDLDIDQDIQRQKEKQRQKQKSQRKPLTKRGADKQNTNRDRQISQSKNRLIISKNKESLD